MDMSKRYSERFKMQVAYDYFVDRCPVNALGDKYKITGDTVRYFCKERRGEYRDAIFRNWKDEEKRLRRAVSDYLSGKSAEIITQEYNICTRRLFRMVDTRCNSYLIEPPKFTAEELAKPKAFVCVNDMAQEILKLDVQHCPLYGIRDATTGKWLQRLDKSGNMHPLLYSTVYEANEKLSQIRKIRALHNVGAIELKAQWYGWKHERERKC